MRRPVASLSPPGLFGGHPQPFPSCHLPFQWHDATQPLAGPFRLTRRRDCNDGAFFTLGVLVWGAGPGAGGCSCSTLRLRALPSLGLALWPRAWKSFFSPRVEARLVLLFLLPSEGAAERGPGRALTPWDALQCKVGREVGAGGRADRPSGYCGP